MEKIRLVSSLIEEQKKSEYLVLTSVLIAIGVNVFSSGIIALLGLEHSGVIQILVGILICICVVFRIVLSRLKSLNQTVELEGFIIYNEKEKKIVNVPEYEISTDMVMYLKSAFSENKALETLWNKDTIGFQRVTCDKPKQQIKLIPTYSSEIFVELLEYCIIEKLSNHLSSFFNNDKKMKVRKYRSGDIPDILLSNRFLKLFSEDMLNRAAFTDNKMFDTNAIEPKGEIVYAIGETGAMFNRFDLILPEQCIITRKDKNTLQIITPLFTISISIKFYGFNTNLRRGFHEYYLGISTPLKDYHDYEYKVDISTKFKAKSFFYTDKETYYSWIDSYIDSLSEYMSRDNFFQRINWDVVCSVLRCEVNVNNKQHCQDV